MKMNKIIILSILVFMLVPTLPNSPLVIEKADAWSGLTHGWLSRTAITFMPAPWNETLLEQLTFFEENSDLPDNIRSSLTGIEKSKEGPRHYIDADVKWDDYLYLFNETYHPQPEFGVSIDSNDPRNSDDYQLGVVPWATENWTVIIADLLKAEYTWDSTEVLEAMCMAAHYVQDSWMPFHAVSFYDGQITPKNPLDPNDKGIFYNGSTKNPLGQVGIHSRVENTLLQQSYPTEVQSILSSIEGKYSAEYTNPFMASWRGASTGELAARELLAVSDVYGFTFSSAEWYNALWNYTGGENGSLIQRLINASIETANIWYTAFAMAGLIDDPNANPTTTEEETLPSTTQDTITEEPTTEEPTSEETTESTTIEETTTEEPTSETSYGFQLVIFFIGIFFIIYRRK